MKKYLVIVLTTISILGFSQTNVIRDIKSQQTYCNPINLNYRFCLDAPSRREAADPVIVTYKNEYYLFASKSGGYWHSNDLLDWKYIGNTNLPIEDYAPAAVVYKDTLYFMASGPNPVTIYKTADPKSGKWKIVTATFPITMADPALFVDDNNKIYLYYGCSNKEPINVVELDNNTFLPISKPIQCIAINKDTLGWEQPGDYNTKSDNPWNEGPWMTKYNGTYYLQYATPGTEYKSYCDAVYISNSPTGPFTLAQHNPFSYKPEGFVNAAGHSATFKDLYGNYWHISTATISQKHMFERRLSLYPLYFNDKGTMYANTKFGDFPIYMPRKKISSPEELFPYWMILSYKKPITTSSELPDHSNSFASDENIRTYWSAQSGDKGEWISINLQKLCKIHAIQINFAEHNTQVLGRTSGMYEQYIIEYSDDNKNWKILYDNSLSKSDLPHNYLELSEPIVTQYIRITNMYVPDGNFAIADLRVFGNSDDTYPLLPQNVDISRDPVDPREVTISWKADSSAIGHIICFGTNPNELYSTYQVLGSQNVTIRSLHRNKSYYFRIDSFNEVGYSKGNVISVK